MDTYDKIKDILKYLNIIQKSTKDAEKEIDELESGREVVIPQELLDFYNKINDIGIDFEKLSEEFEQNYSNKNSRSFKNFEKYFYNKDHRTDDDISKLIDLGKISFAKQIKVEQKFCFIETSKCTEIIKAHSIQENGELSLIATYKDNTLYVLGICHNDQTSKKSPKLIGIAHASTFYGFCHHHDQIFEPLDKKLSLPEVELYFLYSLRAFSYSYFQVKSRQDYYLDFIKNILPIINMLVEFTNNNKLIENDEVDLGDIKETVKNGDEKIKLLRFERHRKLILKHLQGKEYAKLTYLKHTFDHLCPIVCSSWAIMEVETEMGFVVSQNNNETYHGYTIMITVVPINKTQSIIVLGRFVSDQDTALIFNIIQNYAKKGKTNFELEMSKLIIRKTENYYFSPTFWEGLNEKEQNLIIEASNLPRPDIFEKDVDFEMINFFDKKYSISKG